MTFAANFDLVEEVTGYPGLFLVCAVAGIPLPYPEDVPLLLAGVRIAMGEWTWAPVLFASLSGVYVRDLVAFGVGRWLGDHVLHSSAVERWLGRARLERASALVSTHGVGAVLIGRFLVGFRAPVFLVAGAMGVRRRQFLFWDAVGLVATVPTLVVLGYGFGLPVIDVVVLIGRRFREGLLLMTLAATAAWLLWAWARERERARAR